MLIKDPIYGYIEFDEDIKKLVDTPEFQRLRRIQQVFGSNYVYPGGVHTRAEHSLGSAYLARKVIENIEAELEKKDKQVTEEEKKSVVVGALLHDIGHGPFSHASEPYLSKFDLNHEDFTRKVILEKLNQKLKAIGLDPELVAEIAAGKQTKKTREKPYLKQIIGSAVDADKLDYLRRDAYHTGAEYGFIDAERVIRFISVHNGQLCIRENALQAVESMLISRVLSFKSIYYHKASRAAHLLIEKAIKEGAEEVGFNSAVEDPFKYLSWDDYTLWTALLNSEKAKKYMEMLRDRRLLKVAFNKKGSVESLSSNLLDIFSSPGLRKDISNRIKEKAGVEGYVRIDSPTLPNLPYHWVDENSRQIPILISKEGKETLKPIGKISRTAKALESFLYAIRVYTEQKNREKVKKAAKEVFSGLGSGGMDELHV